MSHQHDHDVASRQAVTDQLLRETLGEQPEVDLTDRVLGALNAGEAEAAAARVAAAEIGERDMATSPNRWLVAALLLLGLGMVAIIATQQDTRPDEPTEAVQDPKPDEEEMIRVESLEQLRKLLPDVTRVTVEWQRLDDPNVVADIELAGVPVHLTDADRISLVNGLSSTAQMTEPAGWKWMNYVRLHLPDGKHIRMAVYTYGRGARLRLGMQGLRGDFTVGEPAAGVLREALETTELVARMAYGIVLEARDIAGQERFPINLEAMRLYLKDETLLRFLVDYPMLQELDVSGMSKELTGTGLDYIADCGQLHSLDLSGHQLEDDVFAHLLPLTRLERLTMRGVRGLNGVGFDRYTNNSTMRSGPWAIDLSRSEDLTPAGIDQLMAWGPRELQLERCDLDDQDLRLIAHAPRKSLITLSIRGNRAVTSAGVLELLRIETLKTLDVRDCELTAEEIAELREQAGEVKLTLE